MAEDFPENLRYTETDEWVRQEGDEIVSGITSFAAEQLGDVVYIQLPEVDAEFTRGGPFGEIESVKAVSDLFAPISGRITAVNTELDVNPGLVNEEPYGQGWMVRMQPSDRAELNSLLDAQAYEQHTLEHH